MPPAAVCACANRARGRPSLPLPQTATIGQGRCRLESVAMNKLSGVIRIVSAPAIMAVALALNGFLNLATGVASALSVALRLEEVPDYLRLAPSRQFSGVLSVLLGLVLIVLGKGLLERRRRSWALSLAVLGLLMANNLYRGTTPQTAALSGLLIAGLVVFRKQFRVRAQVGVGYVQVIAMISILFALAYGILGSYVLRQQFDGLSTWGDAVYFTFVTYSTLGYGDILPQTPNAKAFVVSMIPIGLASFVTAISALMGPAIEKRLRGVLSIMKTLQHVRDHVIVCGYSNVSESAVEELQRKGVPYVILDDRADLVAHLQSKGHDVICGDPTHKKVLEQASIDGAVGLIAAFDSDSVNILIAITAREMLQSAKGPRFRIVVRVENEENIDKAKRAGADDVVSPSTLGGRQMALSAAERAGSPAS